MWQRLGIVTRYRARTAAVVVGFLAISAMLWPDADERAVAQYRLVIALGYGHLIGAAVFSLPRMRVLVPRGVPPSWFWSFVIVSVAVAFAVYGSIARQHPAVVLAMLAISTWHVVENDRAIAHALARGGTPGPLAHLAAAPLEAVGITLLVIIAFQSLLPGDAASWAGGDAGLQALRATTLGAGALLLLRGRVATGASIVIGSIVVPDLVRRFAWLGYADVFTAATLYHLVGWLVVLRDRARSSAPEIASRQRSRIWALHAAPMLVCAISFVTNGAWAVAARDVLFAPAIYLFWSVLHVVQTAAVRGLERRPAASPVGAAAVRT